MGACYPGAYIDRALGYRKPMRTSASPATAPLAILPVSDLQRQCEEEQQRYRRDPSPQESASCLELVRRAAAQDDDAFTALQPLIALTVRRRHHLLPPEARDELVHEVHVRLFQRLYRNEHPFQVTHFPGFMAYLALTCSSVVNTRFSRGTRAESLEALGEASGFEPSAPDATEEIDRQLRLDRYLALLPSDRHRETFRRRFALGQTPDEIAQAMGLPKRDAYRLIEQSIKVLAAHPEVREMLEA